MHCLGHLKSGHMSPDHFRMTFQMQNPHMEFLELFTFSFRVDLVNSVKKMVREIKVAASHLSWKVELILSCRNLAAWLSGRFRAEVMAWVRSDWRVLLLGLSLDRACAGT